MPPTMPPILAQANPVNPVFDIPSPPPLPDPPPLEHYLFEQPWMPVAVLILVGLILFYSLRNANRTKHAALSAGICLLLAGGLFLLATFVHTPREHARDATQRLIDAVAAADGATLRRELAPEARVVHPRARSGVSAEETASFVERNFAQSAQFQVKSHAVEQFQAARLSPDRVQVQVKVRVLPAATNFPVRAWLRLDYRIEQDKSLRCTGIEAITVQFAN